MLYSFHKAALDYTPVFSIVIPSWNNLPYLQCVIDSIYKNSRYKHQIIVHINEGKDNTEDWLSKHADISYTKSSQNSGVCFAINTASHLAISEYLVLMDDDLYMCPDWDYYLLEEIKTRPDEKWCLSGTMIYRFEEKNSCSIHGKNYGSTPHEFEEERFLKEYNSFEIKDWNGSQWYPMVLPTSVFRAVGGLSVEFTPGMGSDPDFMAKLWLYGIRYYKGVGKSRSYHFARVSTGRVKRNDGNTQFLLKWGISIRIFFKEYLRLGTSFVGYLDEPQKSTVKSIQYIFTRMKYKLKKHPISL